MFACLPGFDDHRLLTVGEGTIKQLFLTITLSAAMSVTAQAQQPDPGVMVMAHGGSAEWTEGVLSAVEPLRDDYNIEVAFGMANASSLQESAATLEARGADEIAVVRLFVSGDSWYERTRQILGLVGGAPMRPAEPHHDEADHGMGHSMALWRIDTGASYALSTEGLANAPEMTEVLTDRARTLSEDPGNEDVLILAHGPAENEENARWLAALEKHADVIRATLPFNEILVETLREDWPETRKIAEQRIREFVKSANTAGRNVIVIPFRVYGFGPYADVLEGLDYVADGQGLVPHPGVTEWIERQIELLLEGPFLRP